METSKNVQTEKISFFSTASRKNNSYDYVKIAKNIAILNQMIQLNLTESEIKGVQSKPTQFAEAKTKGQSTESKIKKSIRSKMQKFEIAIEECKNAEQLKQFNADYKKLSALLHY